MVKAPAPYLLHIQEAIGFIESYINGITFDQFKEDHKTQDAVVRQLEIIGEAASKLEDNTKLNYPEIPWREIADFRNVLAHEYWDVDLDIVWKAVSVEMKVLKDALAPIPNNPNP